MDNRVNCGVDDAVVVAQGLPIGSGRGIHECATYTCSHCERIVYKNKERTRTRGYCKKCSHVICDECDARYVASGHQCIPFKAFADEVQNAAEKGIADPIAAAEFFFNSRIAR